MKSILCWEINTNDREAKEAKTRVLSNVLVISDTTYEPMSCYIWDEGGEIEGGGRFQNVLNVTIAV